MVFLFLHHFSFFHLIVFQKFTFFHTHTIAQTHTHSHFHTIKNSFFPWKTSIIEMNFLWKWKTFYSFLFSLWLYVIFSFVSMFVLLSTDFLLFFHKQICTTFIGLHFMCRKAYSVVYFSSIILISYKLCSSINYCKNIYTNLWNKHFQSKKYIETQKKEFQLT